MPVHKDSHIPGFCTIPTQQPVPSEDHKVAFLDEGLRLGSCVNIKVIVLGVGVGVEVLRNLIIGETEKAYVKILVL